MRRLMSSGMVATLFVLAVGAGCAVETEDEGLGDEGALLGEEGELDEADPEALASISEAGVPEGDGIDVRVEAPDGHGSTESTIAPSCVKLVTNSWSWLNAKRIVKVRNDCSTTQKVGLDLRFEADPDCVTLRPGSSSTWTWRTNKSLTKVKKC